MPANQVDPATFDYVSTMLGTASILLGAIGILLALFALPVFGFLRLRAEAVARESAERALEDAVERIEVSAAQQVEKMLPKLVKDYMDVVKGSVSDSEANDIAAAQDLEPGE